MTHEDIIPQYLSGLGVELGAHTTPLPGINPIYIDKFEVYVGEPCIADFYGDARDLPFYDNTLDYVASSHVLEHVANPVAALEEWYRVLKPGGIAFFVIPDKKYTFDRTRETTSVDHMLEDYFNKVTDRDTTHIDDFIYNRDILAARPNLTEDEILEIRKNDKITYWEKIENGEEINLHFHVFEPTQLLEFLDAINECQEIPFLFEILKIEEKYPSNIPNGILAILKKPEKNKWFSFIKGKIQSLNNNSYPLKEDAKAFGQINS